MKNTKKWEPINNRERALIIVTIGLVIILIVKSLLFDGVRNLSSDEQTFKTFVDYSIEQEYGGPLKDYGILTYKVIDIYLSEEKEISLLRYQDKITGKMVETNLNGRYTAHVRKMLLFIVPIKEFSVTSQIEGNADLTN